MLTDVQFFAAMIMTLLCGVSLGGFGVLVLVVGLSIQMFKRYATQDPEKSLTTDAMPV